MKTPGPRPVPDRQCLQGILYVLHTGIGWEDLPQERGFRSGMTCRRRIKRWINAGVFRRSASDPACPAEHGKQDRLHACHLAQRAESSAVTRSSTTHVSAALHAGRACFEVNVLDLA
ncbi:transposase [Streptomyces sp. S.PB5]|uniref:transposase n=1 Tax=Streptomyces sp. S.PB5 TaxID=3020844 RepID=UPI00339DA0ED